MNQGSDVVVVTECNGYKLFRQPVAFATVVAPNFIQLNCAAFNVLCFVPHKL